MLAQQGNIVALHNNHNDEYKSKMKNISELYFITRLKNLFINATAIIIRITLETTLNNVITIRIHRKENNMIFNQSPHLTHNSSILRRLYIISLTIKYSYDILNTSCTMNITTCTHQIRSYTLHL